MGFQEPESVAPPVPKVEKKKKKVVKEPEVENKYLVVKELPTQPVRQTKDPETGALTTFITIEEALTNLIGGDL